MSKIRNTEKLINGSFSTLAMLSQQTKILNISTILVYGHVRILWTYKKANILVG